LGRLYSSDLGDKRDKVRAYIGEGEREVNRVTLLIAQPSQSSRWLIGPLAATAQLKVSAVEPGTAIARIDGLCWPRVGAIFPMNQVQAEHTD
jgi:hypothetical protein